MRMMPILSLVILLLTSCNGNLLFDPSNPAEATVPATTAEIYARGLWVVGGQTSTYVAGAANLVAQVDVFDPVTRIWYPNVTQLPVPVTFAGVAGHRGKLYVAGGFNASGANTQALQIYDIATGIWTTGLNMSAIRANHDLMAKDGYLYATSGTNVALYSNTWAASQGTWLRYDIGLNTWANRTNINGFADGQAINVYGIFHHFGGRSSATALASFHEGYLANVSVADTATSGTTEVVLSRVGTGTGFYPVPGGTGYLLIAGGISATLTGTPHAYLFDGATSTTTVFTNSIYYLRAPFESPSAWTLAAASLPYPVAMIQGQVYGDTFFLFGGTRTMPTPTPTDEVWYLSLSGFPNAPAQIQKGPSMPVGRFGHKVVKIVP